MKNLKRALCLALSSVMLMGMMVVGSGASYKDVDADDNVEAIEVLEAIEVMSGKGDGFDPDGKLTRQEMAVVMCNLLDYTVSSYKGTTQFTDVDSWALPFVEACYTNGIIAGYSATEFGAQDGVTTGQAALMLMKALGYFQEVGDFGQDWLVATTKQGAIIELFDGVDTGAREELTRNDVAQLVLNALKADLVMIDSHDIVSDGKGGFATKANYEARPIMNAANDTIWVDTDMQLGEELYSGKLVQYATNDDFARPAVEWAFKGDSIGVYAYEPAKVLVADKSMTLQSMLTGANYFDIAAKKVGTAAANAYTNGLDTTVTLSDTTTVLPTDVVAGDTVEVYKDKYGNVTDVVVLRYTLAKVEDLDENVKSEDAAHGTKYYVELVGLDNTNVIGAARYKNNKIAGWDDDTFALGNYVMVAMSKDSLGNDIIIDSYAAKTVTGAISDYKQLSNNTAYVILDGTKYFVNKAKDGDSINEVNVDFVDGTYELYLDANNYVMGIRGTHVVDVEDVYYVTGVVYDKSGVFGGNTYYAQAINLVTGKVENVVLEKDCYDALDALAGGVNAVNTLSAVNRLYSFTDNDATMSANAKSGNGKMTVKAYTGDGVEYFVVTDTYNAAANNIKKDTKSLTLNGKVYYLVDKTNYVLISDANDIADQKVSLATGGVNVSNAANNDLVVYAIYHKEGSALVSDYVVLADKTDAIDGGYAFADTVYLPGNSVVKVKDGWKTTLYDLNGESYEVTMDARNYTESKYYTFRETDGIFNLVSDVPTADASTNTGALENRVLTSLFNGGLSTAGFYDAATDTVYTAGALAGLIADDATVIDIRSDADRDADVYVGKIDDLNTLAKAMHRGWVRADLFMDEDEVVMIAVYNVQNA